MHATVIVVGNDFRSALEPFKDSNDEDNQYVEFEDDTDKVEKEWLEGEVEVFVHSDGRIQYTWDVEPDKEKLKTIDMLRLPDMSTEEKMFYLPPGRKTSMSHQELCNHWNRSKEEWIEDWFGYQKKGDKYGFYTNPNGRWDWYVMGGRWRGYFKVKMMPLLEDPSGPDIHGLGRGEIQKLIDLYNNDPDKFHKIINKYQGRSEDIKIYIMSMANLVYYPYILGEASWYNESEKVRPGWCDQLQKGHIDIDGMKNAAADAAETQFRKFEDVTFGLEPSDDFDSPWCQALYENELFAYMTPPKEYYCVGSKDPKAEFIQRAIDRCLIPNSLLLNGVWYSKGDMEEGEDWASKFWNLFDSIKDDEMVTLVDFHF